MAAHPPADETCHQGNDDGSSRHAMSESVANMRSDHTGTQPHIAAGGFDHSRASSRDVCCSSSCELDAGTQRREWSRRLQMVCGTGAILCLLAVAQVMQDGGGGWGLSSLEQVNGGAKTALNRKALQAVKEMYHQDPAFVKDWALLTGRDGQKLLQKIQGPKKETAQKMPEHSFIKLDNDLQQLDTTTQDVAEEITQEENGGEKKMDLSLPEVNQRAAWMLVKDLSRDWDVHSNYSTSPWEFCAGRHLSKRQIAQCTEHLMSAAGIKAHRDLNLNAKIYDRFCTGFEHTYFDRYGSPEPLPRDAAERCAKVVTARNNVDDLLKRQVTQYRWHSDEKTGQLLPPKKEIRGSHDVPCSEIPEGCR